MLRLSVPWGAAARDVPSRKATGRFRIDRTIWSSTTEHDPHQIEQQWQRCRSRCARQRHDSGIAIKAVDPVVQSSNQAAVFLPRSGLDEFLFAPVTDETNGMTLSVLSMLARTGVDPWSEAAELARLPQAKASDALTTLIGELPRGLVPNGETESIVARLVALLPLRQNSKIILSRAVQSSGALTQTHAVTIAAMLICFLMGAVWFVAGRQSLAQVGRHLPAATVAVAAHKPPPRAVR